MEDEDFLAAVEADNAGEPVSEVPEPAPVELSPAETTVDEAPAQPATEPANPLTPPVVEHKPDPGFVPISVVLDERDKRKALEAEVAQFRAAQQQPQQVQVPDMFEDPEGYQNFQVQSANQAALNVKLDLSEESAREKHGDDLVDKAREWALEQFQRRPGYQQEVFSQRNPYGYVVQQYQREQIAMQVKPEDFAEFQAWKAAQAQIAQPQQPAAPAASPSPAIPPRSLASAPSAGGIATEVAQSDDEIFAETFARK